MTDDSVHPKTRARWRAWLQRHHATSRGVWLIDWKKGSGQKPLGYDAAVEEALCFGWVDSRPRKLDEARTMLWFTPRQPGSGWAATNKARIERLLAAGRLAEAGQRAVDAARRDGSWNALDAVEALEVPPDLLQALVAHGDARRHFDAFPRSVRRGILEWIGSAKKPETRAKRIDETARLAAGNVRANQWRPRGTPSES